MSAKRINAPETALLADARISEDTGMSAIEPGDLNESLDREVERITTEYRQMRSLLGRAVAGLWDQPLNAEGRKWLDEVVALLAKLNGDGT